MAGMSKRVSERLRNSRYVLSSSKVHGERISKAMAERVEGWDPAGAKLLLETLSRHLEKASGELKASEMAYAEEQSDDPRALSERNEALKRLRIFLKSLRGFMRGQDAEMLEYYGLTKAPPRGIQSVIHYADSTSRILIYNSVPFVDPIGLSFDPSAAGQSLSDLAESCKAAVKKVHQEMRELESLLVERDRQLEAWRVAYTAVSNVLVSFYQLAGEHELAQRIRPTQRKTRGEAKVGGG